MSVSLHIRVSMKRITDTSTTVRFTHDNISCSKPMARPPTEYWFKFARVRSGPGVADECERQVGELRKALPRRRHLRVVELPKRRLPHLVLFVATKSRAIGRFVLMQNHAPHKKLLRWWHLTQERQFFCPLQVDDGIDIRFTVAAHMLPSSET